MMRQGELKAASLSSPARGWLRDIASPQSAVCVGGGGGRTLSSTQSRVTWPGLEVYVVINTYDSGWQGGPQAAGRETCLSGSKGPWHECPRTPPQDLTPTRLQKTRWAGRQRSSSKPGAPVLGGGRSRRTHSRGRGRRFAACPVKALEFETPGRRLCVRSRGCPKRKGQGAPWVQCSGSRPSEIASGFVRPHPAQTQSRFPGASFGGGAAQWKPIGQRMNNVRRFSPWIGRFVGACKE